MHLHRYKQSASQKIPVVSFFFPFISIVHIEMFLLTLLVSTIALSTAGILNWQEFGPYNQRDADYKRLKWLFSNKLGHKESPQNYNVCRSKECFKIASEFWESMNKKIDPCEDFYEYACGNWKTNNPIPPSEMQWSPLYKMQKSVDYKIRDLLEESVHADDVLVVKQVKKFYQSCMNIDEIEKLGIKPLEAILVRNGGWPMIMEPGEWDPEEYSWKQIHDYYSQLTESSALYKISVTRDTRGLASYEDFIKKEIKMAISLDEPKLPTVVVKSEESFDRKKMYEDGSYSKFITNVAMIFAAKREAHIDEKQIQKDVKDMIELEKILGDVTDTFTISSYEKLILDDFSETIYHTFDELQEFYDKLIVHTSVSKINWKKTITDLFAEVNVELDENETVKVAPVKNLYRLANLLQRTSLRTIVNYIHWHFLSNMLPYTSAKIQELEYEIKKVQTGVKEETPRWQTCVDNIKMKHAVSYLFIKKYFQDKMRTDAEKLILAIKKEITKQILKSDWLDDRVRKMQLEKVKKMRKNIGYPDWYNNITLLNNHYRGVVTGHDFLTNVLSYKKYALKRSLRSLKVLPKKDEWYVHPIIVNALFLPEDNAFTVPAADFQLPIYTVTQLQTINYGALGVMISHEVSHAFDYEGHNYDQDGHRTNWTAEIAEIYEKKSICFVNQYNDFYENSTGKNATSLSFGMNLGQLKLEENMADSLGLETIFNAFEDQESEKKQSRLPGFEDLNNEQLFFLNFAKLWCENSTPEFDEIRVVRDSHSKPRYRVISSLQNSEGFSKAYNCPVGSRMNPELKCKLWK